MSARGSKSLIRGAVSPSDVAAWQSLDLDAPDVALALRNACVALAARDADGANVAALAVMAGARVFLSLAPNVQTVTYAARRAVRFARQTLAEWAREDADGTVFVDMTDPDVRLRLDHWQARPDAVAHESQGAALREAFNALISRLDSGEPGAMVVSAVWGEIADAWLSHDARFCVRCSEPGARPGTLSLATIRAHVAGIPTDAAAWKAGKRADGRVVALVMGAVGALVESRGWEAGAVFPLIYGQAWRAVERGDSRDYGAPVVPTVAARESWRVARRVAPVAGPASVGMLWAATDALGYDGALGYAPDALGYDTTLGYGTLAPRRVVQPARPVTLREASPVTTLARQAPDVRVRVPGKAPRDMTEAEVAALAPVKRVRPVPFSGEYVENGRYGSAPAPERDRARNGQVRAFPTRVSPRKRAGSGATGPTVPAQGMTR